MAVFNFLLSNSSKFTTASRIKLKPLLKIQRLVNLHSDFKRWQPKGRLADAPPFQGNLDSLKVTQVHQESQTQETRIDHLDSRKYQSKCDRGLSFSACFCFHCQRRRLIGCRHKQHEDLGTDKLMQQSSHQVGVLAGSVGRKAILTLIRTALRSVLTQTKVSFSCKGSENLRLKFRHLGSSNTLITFKTCVESFSINTRCQKGRLN